MKESISVMLRSNNLNSLPSDVTKSSLSKKKNSRVKITTLLVVIFSSRSLRSASGVHIVNR